TQDPVARQPGIAPVTRATGRHGPSVCVIRSALSDPDRSGQTGHTAAAAPAVPPGGQNPQKALFPYLGKGLDVSRRQAATLHLECGGAGQPALSQDAKECLPGADARADPCAPGAGYVAYTPSRRLTTNPYITSSCTGWINPVALLQSPFFRKIPQS